jgi:PRTRC genetic system protein E
MLFTKLFPLLVSTGLVLDIKQTEENKIKLIIKFNVTDENSEKINLNPLVLEGTPEEFDNGLIDELIEQMTVSVPSILSQVNVLTANLKKVLEEKTNTAKGETKTSKAVKVEDKSTPDLFAKEEVKPKRTRRSKEQIAADKKAVVETPVEEVVEEKTKEIESNDDSLDLGLDEPIKKTAPELVKEIAEEVKEEIIDRIELDKNEEEEDDDNPFV